MFLGEFLMYLSRSIQGSNKKDYWLMANLTSLQMNFFGMFKISHLHPCLKLSHNCKIHVKLGMLQMMTKDISIIVNSVLSSQMIFLIYSFDTVRKTENQITLLHSSMSIMLSIFQSLLPPATVVFGSFFLNSLMKERE